ncbi:Protein N-acetyltransferase, RimJ/RimL family [Amycolatopsis arida]|uniref:Protein N-acetyltransferase, RimJ/RimL family n=1 Tax=Amycolatopsis arida TaxID=587909 RepID=A0A1I5YIK1_9PSEU|nr:GNAT family N-acetyltransferase [Amycolatopsis arida]TDX90538.1 RimJ/RimL family protein N-acetyltransferase [Amycolatopsis arida]SFQ43988.1 Protein N-acetyltransferase, RimJ/RimL family [Amycolatopsis arida]
MEIPEPWPPRHLVLRTPRLELRPDDDAGLLELAEEAHRGIHPPEVMPFVVPWTDAPLEELGRTLLQYHWRIRAELGPDGWNLNFLVRLDGRVVGTQGLGAKDFRVTRCVHTGSWLGRQHQGQGIGTEMRAAVLMLAFDYLNATEARSGAFSDNVASLRVSEQLGYQRDGTNRIARKGLPATEHRLVLTPERFAAHRPGWRLRVEGLNGCLPLLTGSNTAS